MEDLLDPSIPDIYERIALWTVDASEADLAAFFSAYNKANKDPSGEKDLIFINWTRTNPAAALAAVAGTNMEITSWWAWGVNDPEASLAAAIKAGPKFVSMVAWGIGQSNPQWVRDHLEEFPEIARGNAVSGISQWQDGQDPQGALDFAIKNGQMIDERTLRIFLNKDPWAAYEWMQKNGARASRYYGNQDGSMDLLLKNMATSQPEVLQRIADQTPPGDAKRKMNRLLFDQLVKTDPDAALAQANATKGPRIAAERLAAVSLSKIAADPEQGFATLNRILELCPGALTGQITTRGPNSSIGSSSDPVQGVSDLLNVLVAKDPARLLEAQPPGGSDPSGGQPAFSIIADTWARSDLSGLAAWTNQQNDPKVHDAAAFNIISQYQNQEDYASATQWAMSLETNRSNSLNNLVQNWASRDLPSCQQWLTTADVTPEERQTLGKVLESYQSR
ncbi:MAG: hypothetical protein JWO82_579 [Akkermansiaceae bacterium]|nr:hypothetical protein [Akkermansiaceae bacterium]